MAVRFRTEPAGQSQYFWEFREASRLPVKIASKTVFGGSTSCIQPWARRGQQSDKPTLRQHRADSESGLLISPESEQPRQNLGSAYHVRGTTRYNLHSFCDARVLTGKNNRTMSIFERAVEADDFSLLASMTGRKMSRFTPIYSCAVALIQYTRV